MLRFLYSCAEHAEVPDKAELSHLVVIARYRSECHLHNLVNKQPFCGVASFFARLIS